MRQSIFNTQSILLLFLVIIGNTAFSQTIHKNLRYGDEHYYNEEYGESEEAYRKALQQDSNSVNANYNLGNVLFQQERFNEAANYYAEAVENAENEQQKGNAYHNLGNANIAQLESLNDPQQQQQALGQGIEAYKNALKINPDDNATKYNLAYAQRLLKQMQQNPPPQQQQSGDGENQEQQQQEQENNQENQPEQQPEQQKKEEQEKQEPQPKQGEMTKKEAERLLKIIEEEERKVQNKINKEKAKATPKSKDW